jgi:hypothetical protein
MIYFISKASNLSVLMASNASLPFLQLHCSVPMSVSTQTVLGFFRDSPQPLEVISGRVPQLGDGSFIQNSLQITTDPATSSATV